MAEEFLLRYLTDVEKDQAERWADYLSERYVKPLDGQLESLRDRVNAHFESRLSVLTVGLPCKVVAEYVGGLYPDVVVDGKDCISAQFSFLKPEMSLREKAMEVLPRDILPRQQFPDAWGHLPSHVRLE